MGKRISFILRNCILFILAFCLCLSTGCSKNTEDVDGIDISQSGRIETTIENLEGETFARIEADIIGDVTESYPSVTLHKYVFTEEDIKTYADAFFDNSEYHNKRYIDEYTVSDLDEIIDRHIKYKEDIDNNKPDAMPDYAEVMNTIDSYIEYYTDLRAKAPNNVTLRCDTTFAPYEIEKDPMYNIDGWFNWMISPITSGEQYCILEGLHNGIEYTMTFSKDVENDLTYMNIELNSPDSVVWKDFTYDEISCDSNGQFESTPTDEENVCKYTQNQAIAMCNDMMNTLQISDMTVISVADINTTNFLNPFAMTYVNETGVCGYEVAYGKTVNNKPINYNINNIAYDIHSSTIIDKGEGEEEYEFGYETLIIRVMDSGVVSVRYGFPTTIESVSSEDTPLLPFDDVMLIFENKMTEKYGDEGIYKNEANNIVINKIQLGLCRVTVDDANGDYILVPAWDFYSSEYRTEMTINAIDGSMINCYSPSVNTEGDGIPKG